MANPAQGSNGSAGESDVAVADKVIAAQDSGPHSIDEAAGAQPAGAPPAAKAGSARKASGKAPAVKPDPIKQVDDAEPAGALESGITAKAALQASTSTAAVQAASMEAEAVPAEPEPASTEPAPEPEPTDLQPQVEQLKETSMSSNPDMNAAATDAVGEMQNRSKAAFEKSTEMMTDASETAKGNVEAVVESGKIFSTGMQDLARAYVEDAKSAYEQITADLKEMAAVKSPTELLQLQGKIMRRNFDAVVANTSKNTEKMMKLSNEAFAPITARLNVAADKITKS